MGTCLLFVFLCNTGGFKRLSGLNLTPLCPYYRCKRIPQHAVNEHWLTLHRGWLEPVWLIWPDRRRSSVPPSLQCWRPQVRWNRFKEITFIPLESCSVTKMYTVLKQSRCHLAVIYLCLEAFKRFCKQSGHQRDLDRSVPKVIWCICFCNVCLRTDLICCSLAKTNSVHTPVHPQCA